MLLVFRLVLTLGWIIISCTIGIILSLLKPFDVRNTTRAARMFGMARYILGIEIEVRNREILDKERPAVFLSNHQDNLDLIPGGYTVPDKTVTIGKKSLAYLPFFGQFFWLCGNILIDRKNKKNAFMAMDQAANVIIEKKISIWIMPEGTRSKGRGLLPFKKGAFVTAIKAQVPVVPVVMSNYVGKIKLNKWKAGKIIVVVLPPISTIGLTMTDATELKDKSYNIMKEALVKIDQELANE
jgi:1-acyl-sn-glycerol-3-phosphate acyltransferase